MSKVLFNSMLICSGFTFSISAVSVVYSRAFPLLRTYRVFLISSCTGGSVEISRSSLSRSSSCCSGAIVVPLFSTSWKCFSHLFFLASLFFNSSSSLGPWYTQWLWGSDRRLATFIACCRLASCCWVIHLAIFPWKLPTDRPGRPLLQSLATRKCILYLSYIYKSYISLMLSSRKSLVASCYPWYIQRHSKIAE